MSNIFATLASGTKFTGKRNKEVIDVFRAKDVKKQRPVIDIFGDSTIGDSAADLIDEKNESDENESDSEDDSTGGVSLERDDEVNAFRNRMAIKVKGNNPPKPIPTFYSMDMEKDLKNVIISNIEKSDWKEPTPIQMQGIPSMLAGRDVLAAAPTGSGKTAAFVIPTLALLKAPSSAGIRALLLAPTRELAEQIHREVLRLVEGRRFKVCLLSKKISSKAITGQDKGWSRKYDLIVATPLRLLSVVRAQAIDLSSVKVVVLDEADKLFDLEAGKGNKAKEEGEEDDINFTKKSSGKVKTAGTKRKHSENESDEENSDECSDEESHEHKASADRIRTSFLSQVDEILAECPAQGVQRALYSATVGPFVRELAESFLNNPVRITIGQENAGASTIDQKLTFVGREDGKLLAIRQIVQAGLRPPVLLFVQSIDRAKELYRELIYDGINVDVMHAERSPAQREEVIRRFRTGDIWVLICTDLMARGIDFKGVQMVINYDLPQTAVAYIHRIGRTGRAGRRGQAITLFTEADMPRIRSIANVVKLSGCEVPDWMLAIKQLSTKEKKQLRRSAPLRRHIDTAAGAGAVKRDVGSGTSKGVDKSSYSGGKSGGKKPRRDN
eukprot:CAMPEP_0170405656 /NCGR_PEP_ID=MMETSP0117_2-20130122/27298_1 /TAXON_ID=400756 /ORGANISM="Durinskia baltica, Strain CSIRO CS-38" /LENGTH=612 /DNA_ID=CAMNT_0010662787 /DNA_START=36 /DNA_END=1874 /DNA_ORIENTATION=-